MRNHIEWDKFLEYLAENEADLSLTVMPVPGYPEKAPHFKRIHNGNVLWVHKPKLWPKDGFINLIAAERICSRLEIPVPIPVYELVEL